ncbi:putative DUF2938 family protein [Octadecabacter antarcticus 307]|uniref:Putative DUF2938 family protein n=1 Tax=Octadecabacter antarcticus 307 TaxID=391626 RepID=M9R770_9RHOB|nr:DUF2938 family protein [Octadecabacter antarcticus]AGI67618.1 putative DUF2938 family protein [Octadecabacter antarcticus 307]
MDKVLLDGFVISIGATLFMDLVALFLKQSLSIQPLNYSLVGRWFVHLLQGRVRHSPITASPARSYESLIGWTLHHLTGVVFVLIFLSFVGDKWLITPRLGPALAFGALTVIIPFLMCAASKNTTRRSAILPTRSPPMLAVRTKWMHFATLSRMTISTPRYRMLNAVLQPHDLRMRSAKDLAFRTLRFPILISKPLMQCSVAACLTLKLKG